VVSVFWSLCACCCSLRCLRTIRCSYTLRLHPIHLVPLIASRTLYQPSIPTLARPYTRLPLLYSTQISFVVCARLVRVIPFKSRPLFTTTRSRTYLPIYHSHCVCGSWFSVVCCCCSSSCYDCHHVACSPTTIILLHHHHHFAFDLQQPHYQPHFYLTHLVYCVLRHLLSPWFYDCVCVESVMGA
jgi:hypothetical protein